VAEGLLWPWWLLGGRAAAAGGGARSSALWRPCTVADSQSVDCWQQFILILLGLPVADSSRQGNTTMGVSHGGCRPGVRCTCM
jgi:hypothetical protein